MTCLFYLGPAAEAKGLPKCPLRLNSGGTGNENWTDTKPIWNIRSLVNLIQTSGTILVGLLSQLQVT